MLIKKMAIFSQKHFSLPREEIAHRDGRNYRDAVMKTLIGVVVLTRYNNKTYRVDDIDWNQSPKSTFTTHREGEVSVFMWLLEYQRTAYCGYVCLVPRVVVGIAAS
jgi:hypothetical protein